MNDPVEGVPSDEEERETCKWEKAKKGAHEILSSTIPSAWLSKKCQYQFFWFFTARIKPQSTGFTRNASIQAMLEEDPIEYVSYWRRRVRKLLLSRQRRDLVPRLSCKQPHQNVLPPDTPAIAPQRTPGTSVQAAPVITDFVVVQHFVRDAVSLQVGRVVRDLLKLVNGTDLDMLNHCIYG
ncbi:hypothetical protein AZE42_04364 [Rhizopogon vesiculosus]|uniref:Uncharacterized protein n=1 Tax=Rhizopogon vesiculosus TaxID=180088 RepID=A0A1J8Q436_9AGAM|nr:hypothetical protein AZE42_04364 [Rhizopogon vesiculosus]